MRALIELFIFEQCYRKYSIGGFVLLREAPEMFSWIIFFALALAGDYERRVGWFEIISLSVLNTVTCIIAWPVLEAYWEELVDSIQRHTWLAILLSMMYFARSYLVIKKYLENPGWTF